MAVKYDTKIDDLLNCLQRNWYKLFFLLFTSCKNLINGIRPMLLTLKMPLRVTLKGFHLIFTANLTKLLIHQ